MDRWCSHCVTIGKFTYELSHIMLVSRLELKVIRYTQPMSLAPTNKVSGSLNMKYSLSTQIKEEPFLGIKLLGDYLVLRFMREIHKMNVEGNCVSFYDPGS